MVPSPVRNAVLGLGLSSLFAVLPARAAVFTVNSTADTDDGICDASSCTLREAINAANASGGADTIRFGIGSGPKTISVLSALPTITDPVTIDGTTQPGFAGSPIIEIEGSSAPTGTNGLRISAGSSIVAGLVVNRFKTGFPAVGGNGIQLDTGGGNEIRGCYVGTNVAGTAALGNGQHGILITSSSNNLVGRTSASSRINVISGNQGDGVHVEGASDSNVIAGDRIGTNAAGTADLGNSINGVVVTAGSANAVGSGIYGDTLVSGNGGDGVKLTTLATGSVVQNCYIGTNVSGTAAIGNDLQGVEITGNVTASNVVGPSNVISGNVGSGVLIISGATGNTVFNNFVGLDATGEAALGNLLNGIIVSGADGNVVGPGNVVSGNGTNGVRLRTGAASNVVKGNLIGVDALVGFAVANVAEGVQCNDGATGNTIGGSLTDRNVISGNAGHGVLLLDATTTGNVVAGNFIGTNATASVGIPNALGGVAIQGGSSDNTIGGAATGTKNVISANGGPGVAVESGTGNAILGNTISYNAGLGIDLGAPGVTPNDLGDPDPGANLLQNFPVLTSVALDASATQVQGSLNSVASTSYRIELFATLTCDSSGYGPGQRFLGAADRKTDGGGNVAFVVGVSAAANGPWVPATATDPAGNTSEFAACVAVPGPSVTSLSPTSGPAGGGTAVTVGGANFQTGAALKIGGAPAGGSVSSGTEIDGVSPALPAGALYDVTVTNPSTLSATLAGAWLADFTDVPQGNLFHADVEKVFRHGITAGCGGGAFCVASAVTRAQMAVFLLKAEHGASYVPPSCTGLFDDVTCPGTFADWIEQLAAEGVTAGCGGNDYCPSSPVRRDQMAAFLLKTEHGSAYTPPTCTGIFQDVTCPGLFADWIEQLHAEQITGGCQVTPLLYCPGSSNTRGQMATFLVKTFQLQ
jgi:CSLREA domain-containing protein